MARGKLIGWRPCRWCGKEAEVRSDKKENPYVICFECDPPAQEFTYGHKARVAVIMGAGFRPVTGQAAPPAAPSPAPAPEPAPAPAPAPKKKKGSGLLIGGGDG